jgi:hypothetical protein
MEEVKDASEEVSDSEPEKRGLSSMLGMAATREGSHGGEQRRRETARNGGEQQRGSTRAS